jgi:hypothetical protein
MPREMLMNQMPIPGIDDDKSVTTYLQASDSRQAVSSATTIPAITEWSFIAALS